MKTTGANWKAYLDSWPEGQWFDDSDERVNDEHWEDLEAKASNGQGYLSLTPDDAVVEFTCGVVYATGDDREGVPLVTHFRRWMKSRDQVVIVATVPAAALEAFNAFCKANKISIKE